MKPFLTRDVETDAQFNKCLLWVKKMRKWGAYLETDTVQINKKKYSETIVVNATRVKFFCPVLRTGMDGKTVIKDLSL